MRFKDICVDETITENLLHTLLTLVFYRKTIRCKLIKLLTQSDTKDLDISKLVLALMSLPFSNASVERAFSIININKDKLRNRTSVEIADTILRIRSNLLNGCIAFEFKKIC